MKVVTIGRGSDNDIKIIDSKVSRHHLQIIYDGGAFRVVDCNSANGTYVNERKIAGEVAIHPSDRVRIGNTVLPWQSYFPSQPKRKYLMWVLGAAATLALLITAVYFLTKDDPTPETLPQKTVVKMTEDNGVRYVPMKVNGQELNFVFDTGASSICISTLEAAVLAKNGLLDEGDLIGEQGFVDATGRFSIGARINLRKVQIGDREIHNVEATIIENPSASCLLGQTALSQFGKYTIDNQNNEIIFE